MRHSLLPFTKTNQINNIPLVPRLITIICLLLAALTSAFHTNAAAKREFRGAWIQTVYQPYSQRTTAQNKAYLRQLLDELHTVGINAVIFQVRTRGDAFYRSDIEPWSAYLTGTVGKAPSPYWDPLQFMIDECHARGMELHAWLNPYRGPSTTDKLPASHLLKKSPARFLKYGKAYYYDPSQEKNRELICQVVRDIITRYDVDGIHFDDYFYPYPIAGEKFPDSQAYAKSKSKLSLADWRRANVDALIHDVYTTIQSVKPWLRFGISPFGIWRNARTDPRGSETSGLQNYDDLYADVPSWAEKGWIDYQIPQLYWELDHKRASYRTLCDWWAQQGHDRHIYIGQDVEKTAKANELTEKLSLAAKHPDLIQGHCWWYAGNISQLADQLSRKAYATPALVPEYIWKNAEPADAPTSVKYHHGILSWHSDATKWVVYRFKSSRRIDIENPEAIVAITWTPQLAVTEPGFYVVTALDQANGESAPSAPTRVK
jgi:uncharacterized lipoprotein YddW (UPF0748 family)